MPILKKMHRKEPKGLILYKDDHAIINSYKALSAYNNKKENKEITEDFRNINNVSFKLCDIVSKKYSVSEILNTYQNKKNHLFPNMIIRIHGTVISYSNKHISLRYDDRTIKVTLKIKPEIYIDKPFIKNSFVFLIGIISSLDRKININGILVLQ